MLTASVFFLPLAWDRRQPRDGPIRLRVPISYLFGVAAVIIVYIASILKLARGVRGLQGAVSSRQISGMACLADDVASRPP